MSEITTTSSRVIYENRWMRVREDVVVRPDGTDGIYGVVEKPDFAVIAAVDADCIYLVEQYRHPAGARFWELPQGSWEETPCADPLALARGELQEETGLTANQIVQVGQLFEAYGYSTQNYRVFLASGLNQGPTHRENSEQDMVARRFPIEEVLSMVVSGEIKDSATVAALGLLRLKGLI